MRMVMFNREIQVRTVKVPQGANEEERIKVYIDFEQKADIVTKSAKSILGTAILGVVSYIAADTCRKVIVNATTKRPYWAKPR
jgi:ribosomal protein L14